MSGPTPINGLTIDQAAAADALAAAGRSRLEAQRLLEHRARSDQALRDALTEPFLSAACRQAVAMQDRRQRDDAEQPYAGADR